MIDQALGILVSLALIGLGLTCGVLAAGIAVRLVTAYRASIRSRSWKVTQGRITHSEMIWVGARSRSPRPKVKYAYAIEGTPYEGRRIVFEYSHVYSREAVEPILNAYPIGATVPVYYDPDRPQDSTLRQTHLGILEGLVFGAMLLLPTALCLAAGAIGLVDTLGVR